MQKLIFTLLVLLLLAGLEATAQNSFYLEPRLGIGTFRMKSMKEWQRTAANSIGVKAKTTDRFPPYLQLGLGLLKDLDRNTLVGVFLEHGSTGGRTAYQDYSGEFTIDDLLSYNALGASITSHKPIRENSKLEFLAGIELSAIFSKLTHKEFIKVYEESDESEDSFNAIGLGLKPFVGLQYPLKRFPLSLSVGYMASASGGFHVPGEPDYKLSRNQDGDELEPSWSGLRINVTFAVPIFGQEVNW